MTAVCLVVISILGAWCYHDAAPVGICTQLPAVQLCYVEAEELPLRLSWYDPSLGGINCAAPCDLLGDGTAVNDAYGWAAACPPGWYGRWLDIEYAGRWQCRDHGGAIRPTYREVFIPEVGLQARWFITVDLLTREQPPCAYMLADWQ